MKTAFQSLSINRRTVLSGVVASLTALAASPALARVVSSLRRPLHEIGNRAVGLARANEPVQSTEVFTEQERAIVTRLVEIIVPSDGLPGARETGTAGSVLFALSEQDALVLQGIRQAIAAVDQISVSFFGQPFVMLPNSAAEQVVQAIAGSTELAPFWSSVRTLTVLDFYAQKPGYEPLGLPGPNIDRGGFPGGRSAPGASLCRS